MSVSFATHAPTALTRPLSPAIVGYQQYPAPASQESLASVDSSTSSHDRPSHDSSSNVSQMTTLTEISQSNEFSKPQRPAPLNTQHGPLRTPEERMNPLSPTSPMSITSPVAMSAKRTASGHVKNALSYSSAPLKAAFSPRRPRAESMSSTGSRAGELAASLKMRLGYAMAKVQHGWESKTITEIDSMAAQAQRQHVPQRPTTAGYMSEARHFQNEALDGPASPPSKRRSGTFGVLTSGPEYAAYNASAPHLEPAVDIVSGSAQQSSRRQNRPGSKSTGPYPRTPVGQFPGARPSVIRTDTQTAEAERDALQALTQLGSPQNSQLSWHHNNSQASSSQASPLRHDVSASHRHMPPREDSTSSAASGSIPGSIDAQLAPR